MIEKKIIFVCTREIFSKKQNCNLYQVDYVRLDEKPCCKVDFISHDEFDKINSTAKGKSCFETTGIFNFNLYDKIYLSALK